MSYTTEQLLFAAKVRELASKMRKEAYEDAVAAKCIVMSSEEQDLFFVSQEGAAWKKEWLDAFPMTDFLERALSRIEDAAAFIANRQTGKAA
jgi:hypothetical protein